MGVGPVDLRSTNTGAQTALVVGLNEPAHTNRDDRIKVQFQWQLGSNAGHRRSIALRVEHG